MTQQDVFDFLKSKKGNGKWYTPKQVAEEMGTTVNSATNALRKLREHGFVNYRPGERKDSFIYSL